MGMLITVLQQDFKAHYSPERAASLKRGEWESNDAFFADSKETFIHGLLSGNRAGTCSSLPVLYAAVAQRLGYPVSLVTTKAHFFIRYEEDGKHLNVEGSGEGFNFYSDDFYKSWPLASTDVEIKTNGYLKPLSNKGALGAFLCNRAGNFASAKKFGEAAECWRQAARYLPDTPELRRLVDFAQKRAQAHHEADKWDSLSAEVDKLSIPEGPPFAYFRDRKARTQFFMARSTQLTAIEKEISDLKKDLVGYQSQLIQTRDSAFPPLFNSIPEKQLPQELGVVRIKTLSGKQMQIPAERIPEEYRKKIPPELFAMIATMDDESPIEAEMWAHHAETAAGNQPGRIVISEQQVPYEYILYGILAELQSRLQKLRKSEDVITEMTLFAAEEARLRNSEKGSSHFGSPLPPTWRPQERLKMNQFAKQLGIAESSLPYGYRNQEVSPELQKRIAARTLYIRDGREVAVLDEIRRFESEEMQKRDVVRQVRDRRSELNREILLRPPVEIQIRSENGMAITYPIAPSLPLTPQPQTLKTFGIRNP